MTKRFLGYFDWLMELPPEYNARLIQELQLDKGAPMPEGLVSSLGQLYGDECRREERLEAIALGWT